MTRRHQLLGDEAGELRSSTDEDVNFEGVDRDVRHRRYRNRHHQQHHRHHHYPFESLQEAQEQMVPSQVVVCWFLVAGKYCGIRISAGTLLVAWSRTGGRSTVASTHAPREAVLGGIRHVLERRVLGRQPTLPRVSERRGARVESG